MCSVCVWREFVCMYVMMYKAVPMRQVAECSDCELQTVSLRSKPMPTLKKAPKFQDLFIQAAKYNCVT